MKRHPTGRMQTKRRRVYRRRGKKEECSRAMQCRQFEVTENVVPEETLFCHPSVTPLGSSGVPLLGFGGITMCRCRSTFCSGSISSRPTCSFALSLLLFRMQSSISLTHPQCQSRRRSCLLCASHDNGTERKSWPTKNNTWKPAPNPTRQLFRCVP